MYTGFYQCSLLNVTVLKTSVGNRHLTLPFISNLSSLTAMSKSSALLGKLSSGPLCNIKNILNYKINLIHIIFYHMQQYTLYIHVNNVLSVSHFVVVVNTNLV